MTPVRVSTGASDRLDEIYDHTRRTWGEAQADACIRGLFGKFKAIAARTFPWHPIPAEFGVDGYFCRHEKHVISWKLLTDGRVGIVTTLHERMHQAERLKEALGEPE